MIPYDFEASLTASIATMPPAYAPPTYPAPSVTEADIRRIVREEIDARFPPASVLAVSAEDVRRLCPGLSTRSGPAVHVQQE